MVIDKIYVRHCMLFVFKFDKTAAKMKNMIDEVYRSVESISMCRCHEWFAKFTERWLWLDRQTMLY